LPSVHVQRSGEILQVVGRCIDMSESGLLAAMEGELLDGEDVELDLHVTGSARAGAHPRRTGQYAFQFQRSRGVSGTSHDRPLRDDRTSPVCSEAEWWDDGLVIDHAAISCVPRLLLEFLKFLLLGLENPL